MSAFNGGDVLSNYGGAKNNYSPVVDPTVEFDASELNNAHGAVAGMSRTRTGAWVRMTLNGTATPVLVAQKQTWAPGSPSPTLAYGGSTGIFTVTWPSTVSDEIPFGYPGYTGPTALSLSAGWANIRLGSTLYVAQVNITAANVATVSVFNTLGLANPGSAIDCDVFVI